MAIGDLSFVIQILVSLWVLSSATVVPAAESPDLYPPASAFAIADGAVEEWLLNSGTTDGVGEPAKRELRFLARDSLSVGRFESCCFAWFDRTLSGHVVLLFTSDSLFGSYVSRAENGGPMLGPGLLGLVNAVIAIGGLGRETDSILVAYQRLFFELAFPVAHEDIVLLNWSGIPAFESSSPQGDSSSRLFDRVDFLAWLRAADTTLTDAALELVDLPLVAGDWREHLLTCYYWDHPKHQLRVLRSRFREGAFNWSDSRPAGDPFDEDSWGR